MRKLLSLLTIFAVLLAGATNFAAPPPGKGGGGGGNDGGGTPPPFMYTFQSLDGASPAWTTAEGFNDFLEVVGYVYDSDTIQFTAVMWSPANNWQLVELNSLLSPADQDAWVLEYGEGINSNGQIGGLGKYNGRTTGYRVDPPGPGDAYATITPIGDEPGYSQSGVLAIADNGDMAVGLGLPNADRIIVGYYTDEDYDGDGTPDGLVALDILALLGEPLQGYSWVKDVSHILDGSGQVIGIEVVGYYEDVSGETLGYRYTSGAGLAWEGLEVFDALPGADGSCASVQLFASNDVGQVCGWSQTVVQVNKKQTACETHAIVATSNADVTDLNVGHSGAHGINNSGDIVGSSSDGSFIIDGATGQAYLLDDLVTNMDLSRVSYGPAAINENGDILCYTGVASFLLLRN